MIEQFADAFSELEKKKYRVVGVYMNQETLDRLLLFCPEFAEGVGGVEITVVGYKSSRVHLEGQFVGWCGPHRETAYFHLSRNYSSVSEG